MSKEDYVSLEVAKLLKKKGFDEQCRYTYCGEKEDDIGVSNNKNSNYIKGVYSMPTLYEAQKWLREAHNIDVLPLIREESPKKDYCCYIYKNAQIIRCKVAYGDDFYECMNDGLLESLKLI